MGIFKGRIAIFPSNDGAKALLFARSVIGYTARLEFKSLQLHVRAVYMNNLRIGYGFDIHAFEIGDHIILGGVTIPFSAGLCAHSDGDVIIHALVDALLGAAALGDIGQHFADTDNRWQKCNSRFFLKETVAMLHNINFSINNADITLLAETPKLDPYRQLIRTNLAHDMELDVNQVSVKATTTEKLGFIGRNEGIAAIASVLIHQQVSR